MWGDSARALRERLLEPKGPHQRLRLLERALHQRAFRSLEWHPAVARALELLHRAPALPTITEVTREVGVSSRRLIQLFREQVGLTPKRYCRVLRFQQVIRATHRRREVRWADVAYDCGYADQAHLTREFREFSGFTPTQYLRLRGDQLNHVPLPS